VRHENLKSNAVKPDQGVQYSFETIKNESTAVEKVLETQAELKTDLKPAGAETRIVKAEKTTIPQQNSSVERITRPAKAVNIETVSKDESVNVKQLLKTLRNEKEKADELEKEFAREIEEKLSPEKPIREPFDFRQLKVMGTVFNTYIMASDADSFYLIDQHATHERVFYEKLLKQYNESEKLRQQLLMPLQFHVPAQITASEETWLEKIISMGYDISFFGNNTYIVREIPAFMEMSEAEDFLKDFFKELEDKPDLTNRKTLDRIITRSCKSAVKGGEHLEPVEIDALMKDLHNCVNPFSCPHGRPTFIRMTKYEIEKLFKRV
jgi:DNA mismatch repair protein MutL